MRSFVRLTLAALALVAVAACSSTPPAAKTDAQQVSVQVTEDGFVPARVTVQAGRPVTMLVTRKTEKTCATELVMASQNIHEKLPLNQTVAITFTPTSAGEITYACGMDMISGTVVVQPAQQ